MSPHKTVTEMITNVSLNQTQQGCEHAKDRWSLPVKDVIAESILLQASEGGQVILAWDVQEGCHPHAVTVWAIVFKSN